VRYSASGRVRHSSLDAPENPPKEPQRQVAFRQLENEVSGMPNEVAVGLEQPLQGRQGPALDGGGQDEPVQVMVEVRTDAISGPRCAGRMQLIATIDDPVVIQRILTHLGLPRARAGPPSASSGAAARAEQPALPDMTL
jgi:hypothetical protein